MRWIGLLMLLCILGTTKTTAAEAHCYALLIGINAYADKSDPGIADLTCTQADCELMKQQLSLLSGITAANTSIIELYDTHAVKAEILAALDDIAAKAQPADTVILYYSGHGALVPDFDGDEPAGDGALVLHNFARENRPPTEQEVAAGALTDDEVATQLRRFALQRSVFYIADCCHSGGNERDLADLVDKGFDLPLTNAQIRASGMKAVVPMPDANRLEQSNIVAIFASDSRRKAQEIRSAGHGAMTLCLSQILAQPAVYDADGDQQLELDELSVGLRSLVDSTVRGYSGGARYQLSFVKTLDPQLWLLTAGNGGSAASNATRSAATGVPEPSLDDLITLLRQRCAGRYDAGSDPYKLEQFELLNEDGTPRADNVYLERELYDLRGEPLTSMRFRFSLDAPADVLALFVFGDGQYFLAYPNNPESVAANAAAGVSGGWRVGSFPFEIPNPANYGSDRFLFSFTEDCWEYVVLICSPVALADPYGQGATAFDLLYPFGLLKDQLAGSTTGTDNADGGKGFGSGSTLGASQAGGGEVIAPGKQLTVFCQKYWLKK